MKVLILLDLKINFRMNNMAYEEIWFKELTIFFISFFFFFFFHL